MAEYEIPDELQYSREDEWARVEDGNAVVGITDYAQQQLGDIVYLELPEVGTRISQGETFGVIESVKAVSDLFAPVSGSVLEVNAELGERPEAVNQDCYGDGWMCVIALDADGGTADLLDAMAYRVHIEERDG